MYHTQLGLDWRTKKKWANQTSFFFLLVFTSTTYSLNISACSCKWNVCWYCIKGFSVIRQYTVRTSHTVLANDVNYVHIILQNVPFIPSIHPSNGIAQKVQCIIICRTHERVISRAIRHLPTNNSVHSGIRFVKQVNKIFEFVKNCLQKFLHLIHHQTFS